MGKLTLILSLMDKAIALTETYLMKYSNYDEFLDFVDNRERLVAAIIHLSHPAQLEGKLLKTEQGKIFFEKKAKLQEQNRQVLEKLAQVKKEMQTEITMTYKNKVSHKGYDLSQVK